MEEGKLNFTFYPLFLVFPNICLTMFFLLFHFNSPVFMKIYSLHESKPKLIFTHRNFRTIYSLKILSLYSFSIHY